MPTFTSRFLPPTPKYRHHKASGHAVVTIAGSDHYLGPYGTKASRVEYDRIIGEWLAAGRPTRPKDCTGDAGLTVVELLARYVRFAKGHYAGSAEYGNVCDALKPLKERYGHTLATEFGPLALKALRLRLIEKQQSRRYINLNIGRIRRVFKWAASEELIPVTVYQGLCTVTGLQRGRSQAKEPEPIAPIDDATVEATLPHLPVVVADMVQLQRLTGARPSEICILRPCDVDRSNDVWSYRPQTHKNTHRGHQRVIFFGPRAQTILLPYFLRDAEAYCFCPAESEAKRKIKMRLERKSPVQPSQRNRKKKRPRWQAGEHYDVSSYRRAIHRGCQKADDQAHRSNPKIKDNQILVAQWSPNRLRHTAATEIRRRYGLEAAQVTLGHASAEVSQIYAERDLSLAARIMKEVG